MKKYLLVKYVEIVRASASLTNSRISALSLGVILGVAIYFAPIVLIISLWFCYVSKSLINTTLLFILCILAFFYTQDYVNTRVNEADTHILSATELKAIEPSTLGEYNQTVITKVKGVSSYVLITLPKYPQIKTGQTILAHTQIEGFPSYYSSSYKAYLNSRNIFLYAEVNQEYEIQDANIFYKFINNLQERFKNSIYYYFHEPNSTLLAGITLGFDDDFSTNYKDSLKYSGLSHIAAVSGFNFLIIFSIFLGFSKNIGRKKVLILSIVLITTYLFIVGATNVSALRAGIMIICIILSSLLGKPNLNISTLMITAGLMLLYSPVLITNISFQLSFAATIGILSFYKRFLVSLKPLIGTFFGEITAVSLSAYISTSPIIMHNFGSQGLLAILANITVGEFVGIITILGFIFLVLSLVNIEFLLLAFSSFCEAFLYFTNLIINLLSMLPNFKFPSEALNLAAICTIFLILDYIYYKEKYDS